MAKEYTLEEVSEHKGKSSCWFVVHGKVYDVTKFLEEHPGGDEVLLEAAGKFLFFLGEYYFVHQPSCSGRDASDDFDDIGHSEDAIRMLADYEIGVLKGAPTEKVSVLLTWFPF